MKKIFIKLENNLGPLNLRLDQAIAQNEQAKNLQLSRTLIRKLIFAGALYVNGKRIRVASRTVRGGENIEVYLDESKSVEHLNPKSLPPLRVLYEDEELIFFDKPAQLPTQPTLDEARNNLYALAKKQLEKKRSKPTYLGMHHRLDKDTSGVIVFTLQPQHNAFIAEQFKKHLCKKTYVAVVHGRLEKTKDRLETFLGPVGKFKKMTKFGSIPSGGKKAITDYTVLEQNKKFSLIEVHITTGRTHQVRVHFSEIGHPIVGDFLYGSSQKLDRHLLHAHALVIAHPVTKNLLRIESPVPEEFRKWTL